jgi:hypothetical protein
MGVLDDAIREHLELKRRHGASDEEVQREEAEALGPARRDFPQPAEPAAESGAEAAPETDEQPAEPEQPTEPEAVVVEPPPVEEPPLEEPPVEPEPEPEPEPFEPETRDSRLDTPEDSGPATEEHEVAPRDDDDVLEETPEFLQDAPEHDRLWFEQKPPRDFDFE